MEQLFSQHPWLIILIIVWSLPWKAAALWRSARRGHFGWFFALLIINSLAILDILYIFIFSKKHSQPKQPELTKPEPQKLEVKQEKPAANPSAGKTMIV